MFQAVKSKVCTLLSPILVSKKSKSEDTSSRNVLKSSKLKRHYSEHLNTEMTTPVKRRKSTQSVSSLFSMKQWSLSNIFNYVIGSPIIDNNPGENRDSTRDNIKYEKEKKIESSSAVKRNRLKQISRAEVLDLTIDEGDSDDEVSCTRVTIDLMKDTPVDNINRSDLRNRSVVMATTPSKLSVNSKSTNTGIERLSSPQSLIEESGRHDERKRYQEILSHYTNVSLPEYSNSLSENESERSLMDNTSHDTTVDSIFTSPFFNKKSREFKSPIIDLTADAVYDSKSFELTGKSSYNSPPKKSITSPGFRGPSWQRHSFSMTPDIDLTKDEIEEVTGVISQRREIEAARSKEVAKYESLLGTDWIKKWRDTIDPLQLERERLISLEEKKKEALKKKKLEQLKQAIEEQKSKEFPELTKDILSVVKRVLGPGNPGEIFVTGFSAEIRRSDLATLRDATWLNDEVVNFYFNLIKERSEKEKGLPKVHVCNTFFYPRLMKSGHAGVKRWTRKINLFEMDLILIPVHLGMHWCLAVIDFKNKQLAYYDSMKGNNMQCLQALESYLREESLDKRKTEFDTSDWDLIIPKNIPEQENGCDCGVFMSKYAEYKSRYADFSFKQENMPYFRKRMIYEIVNKKLM